MSCCCESQECRFESADTELALTFLDGRNEIDAYWQAAPRVGDSVWVDSAIVDETAVIAGTVTSIQWRQVRGIYGNPIVLIGVDGFDLKLVQVVVSKNDNRYSLKWPTGTDTPAIALKNMPFTPSRNCIQCNAPMTAKPTDKMAGSFDFTCPNPTCGRAWTLDWEYSLGQVGGIADAASEKELKP